ncbi:hypothetical protein APSETT444_002182 [Aspergillus pseudonomiae]
MPKQTHTAPSSSCGISTAIGIRLAQHGTDPVMNYFSSTSATWKVVEQIRSYGTTTIIVKVDMSHEERITYLCQCVMTKFDQPNIIMSNPGIEHLGTLPDVTPSAKSLQDGGKMTMDDIYAVPSKRPPLKRPGFPENIAGIIALTASAESHVERPI